MSLPPRFEEPAGFKWGSFKDAEGANIRYGSIQPPGAPKGTVVLASGYREPIEKYFEVMRDLTEQGYAVWMMDWRGQGGSDRYIASNPQKMFNKGYEKDVETLHRFATQIVEKSEGPFFYMAHSMGANMGLRYLKEHEGVFDAAVLNAPMLDINTMGIPYAVARAMVRTAQATGKLESYIPKAGDWKPVNFDKNRLTHDPARYAVLPELYRRNPALKMGEATYGWVQESFRSVDILRDEKYLKSIKAPILMGIAGDDKVVDASASARAAGILPNCTRVDMPEAKHEIWMERDDIRAPWMARITAFFAERAGRPTPQPKKSSNGHKPPQP